MSIVVSQWACLTPLGESAQDSCFAYRAGSSGLRECPIVDKNGDAVTLASIPVIDPTVEGLKRVHTLAYSVMNTLLDKCGTTLHRQRMKLYLLLDEYLDQRDEMNANIVDGVALQLQEELRNRTGTTTKIEVVSTGAGGLGALLGTISQELEAGQYEFAVIISAHSDYGVTRIRELSENDRIYSSDNLDALLLGEAGAGVLLCTDRTARTFDLVSPVAITSVHNTHEKARWNNDESAFEAAGLTVASRHVLASPELKGRPIGWLSTDMSFEMFRVHELQTVMARVQSRLASPQVLEAPCQRIGHMGSVVGLWQIIYAAEAFMRGYAPAPDCLCLLGSDTGHRTAFILSISN